MQIFLPKTKSLLQSDWLAWLRPLVAKSCARVVTLILNLSVARLLHLHGAGFVWLVNLTLSDFSAWVAIYL
jgi:hypothetical protein